MSKNWKQNGTDMFWTNRSASIQHRSRTGCPNDVLGGTDTSSPFDEVPDLLEAALFRSRITYETHHPFNEMIPHRHRIDQDLHERSLCGDLLL